MRGLRKISVFQTVLPEGLGFCEGDLGASLGALGRQSRQSLCALLPLQQSSYAVRVLPFGVTC